MKPPVVHDPATPPPAEDGDEPTQEGGDPRAGPPPAESPGLVGNYGPLVRSPEESERDGAGADERKAP